MRHVKRQLELRTDTLRRLTVAELQLAAGGRLATGDACQSVDPCPGEYTWFCSP
jgi:hypothetical protein